MTRPLQLSQRQAQALLRAAEAERAIVEVKVGEVVFRLIPNGLNSQIQPLDNSDEADLDAELAAYEAKHGGG